MSIVFRLDSSIREEGSVTRALASTLESALVSELDDATVVRREIGLTPLPSTAWALSAFGGFTPAEQRTAEQTAAIALAAELGNEMEQADAYIFAVPLYNYGVSQHVKIWADLLLTDPRFQPGSKTIEGRPAFLVTARGGGYGAGTPREGWDHSTSWLVRMFNDILGLDVQTIETELTLADSQPHMADLRDLAAEKLRNAHDAAQSHGKRLAVELSAAEAA
jgi:FMN-dependent NADH-azoreductase